MSEAGCRRASALSADKIVPVSASMTIEAYLGFFWFIAVTAKAGRLFFFFFVAASAENGCNPIASTVRAIRHLVKKLRLVFKTGPIHVCLNLAADGRAGDETAILYILAILSRHLKYRDKKFNFAYSVALHKFRLTVQFIMAKFILCDAARRFVHIYAGYVALPEN